MGNYDALKTEEGLQGPAMGSQALLTPDLARLVGRAFARWCLQQAGLTVTDASTFSIAIGRDSRLTGESLLKACASGMTDIGVQVLDLGLSAKPALFRCLKGERPLAQASVMVTASHRAQDCNGFRFFTPAGGLTDEDLTQIMTLMEQPLPAGTRQGSVRQHDYMKSYRAYLVKLVQDTLDDPVSRPLLGLHVVVDAGNGSCGFYASLLEELGAWTEGSQFLSPDGHFPNRAPNPQDKGALAALSKLVTKRTADLGLLFDADGSRVALVGSKGWVLHRNRLIALVSAMLLNNERGLTIVTDAVTSSGLSKFIGEWGGEHYRYKAGYRHLIEEAICLNEAGFNCPLAVETTGHAAFRENDFLDDGLYLATLVVCEAMRLKREGKALASLLDGLQEPVESLELQLGIQAEDFRAAGLKLIETVMDHADAEGNNWMLAPDNREGIRISFDLDQEIDSAWFLLRLSVHEPLMLLNAESDVSGGLQRILGELYALIKDIPDINFDPLLHQLNQG